MPRSFLIKKARSAADRNGIIASDAGCPPGLDLRVHTSSPSSEHIPFHPAGAAPLSLSTKQCCPPRLQELDLSISSSRGPPLPLPPSRCDLSPGGRRLEEDEDVYRGGRSLPPDHRHSPPRNFHHLEHRSPPPLAPPPGSHLEALGERVKTEPAFAALAPYTPTAMEPLAVRLANGYIHDMYAPSRLHYPSSLPSAHKDHIPTNHVMENELDLYAKSAPREDDARSNASSGMMGTLRDDDQQSLMSLDSAEDLRKRASSTSPGSPVNMSVNGSGSADGERSGSGKAASFQPGVTVAYTYDAFFITDGRSRRRNHLGLAIPDQSRPKYTCNECGKQYATSSNLSRHKQTHRSLESSSAKKCPHCDKVYVSMPALSMHILTHNLKHQCPVCGKAFSRPWLLQGHIRSHSGEKPYGCAHCGKAFADRSNLRAHMQTHSSFKHYECKRCNKTFALKSYLNKHYESACLRDTTSNASDCLNSPPPSPEPYIDVQH